MARLNYHHLYYFWQVARSGNLTRTAEQLHISQSALSAQIKQLEHSMNVQLFHRAHRSLTLTELGQRTFVYAEQIFRQGEELESMLVSGFDSAGRSVRIGTLTTMSRNFIESFVAPLIQNPQLHFSLHALGQEGLLQGVANHQLDLALTNIEVRGSAEQLWQCQLLARQPVAIVGPAGLVTDTEFTAQYRAQRWVLPAREMPIRAAFDAFCAGQRFKPTIAAEADDMAMLRLLARDAEALAVLPAVVVKDELRQGRLVLLMTLPGVYENFYAVSIKRQFPSSLAAELFEHWLATHGEL